MTIKLKDYEERKAFVKDARKKLLGILNSLPPDWHRDENFNPAIVKEIQRLGEIIGNNELGQCRPLAPLKLEEFTREDYFELLEAGYTVDDIRKALGVGKQKFSKWRKERWNLTSRAYKTHYVKGAKEI